ncbi:glucose 1-dehydrogenase [Sphingomonas sp. MA1305]|uniref:glucose 1-dehydrogenase n=1 Tax=Sphingomonas sp. MA1305 TaxID=2479204 RepID=UPI0018DFF073|nr:glucose 1-dehydrogenase [Sphingomonas sp. MA1305]MBI0476713.1 glucose 1-dehydrogenase [Sphingomonas sp. MA1305]
MAKLSGKVAIVTGASKGIGAGIAKALAAEGAAVVVNYASSQADADAVVGGIAAAGGQAIAVRGDVTKADDARALVTAAVERFGRLDVLVNNSGIYEFAPIEEVTEEHYRRQFDVNVLGTLLVTQAASPHLQAGASIVNVSSAITHVHTPGAAVYAGTKGAVNAITGVLANEIAPRQIRVNAVSPGFVVTEGTHSAGIVQSDMAAGIVAQTPLGRAGQPEDIAGVVAFLASDAAGWLTGENITASGGIR